MVLGIEGASTFFNKSGNVMVKCEGFANSYSKYFHFIHSLDTRNGSRVGKIVFSSREVKNHFLRLSVVSNYCL